MYNEDLVKTEVENSEIGVKEEVLWVEEEENWPDQQSLEDYWNEQRKDGISISDEESGSGMNEEREEKEEGEKGGDDDNNGKKRCAYCYEFRSKTSMVDVPLRVEKKKEWIDSLGNRLRTFIKNYPSYPMVCKRHFDLENDFIEKGRRLHPAAVPHPNKMYEKRKFILFGRKKRCLEESIAMKFTCVYCRARVPRSLTKSVPLNPLKHELWCRALGDEFRKKVFQRKQMVICKAHFSRRSRNNPSGEISSYELPMSAEKAKKEEEMEEDDDDQEYEKCAYCYNDDLVENMEPVPGGERRAAWVKALGNRFDSRLKALLSAYICKSHFEETSEDTETEKIPVPDKKLAELDDKKRKKPPPNPNNKKPSGTSCAYCGGSHPFSEMVNVPKDEYRMDIWCSQLGDEFEQNVFDRANPMICKQHLSDRSFNLFGKVKYVATPYPFERATTSQTPVVRNEGIFKKCAYCEKMQPLRKLKKVPDAYQQRVFWTQQLGEKFELNLQIFKNPGVCRSHFVWQVTKRGAVRYKRYPMPDKPQNVPVDLLDLALQKTDPDLPPTDFEMEPGCSEIGIKQELIQPFKERTPLGISRGYVSNLDRWRRKLADRCVYCNDPRSTSGGGQCFIFGYEALMNEYRQAFGAQFYVRVRNGFGNPVGLSLESNQFLLCTRHISEDLRGSLLPDKDCLYAVDELLDHDYADFSEHNYLNNIKKRNFYNPPC